MTTYSIRPEIEIRADEYMWVVKLNGLDVEKLVAYSNAGNILKGYDHWDGNHYSDGGLSWQPKSWDLPVIELSHEGMIVAWGPLEREGDDALDGTLGPATELTNAQMMSVAHITKQLIAVQSTMP